LVSILPDRCENIKPTPLPPSNNTYLKNPFYNMKTLKGPQPKQNLAPWIFLAPSIINKGKASRVMV